MIALLIPFAFWLFIAILGPAVVILIDSQQRVWENVRIILLLDAIVVVGFTMILFTIAYVASSV